jgi:hypothetical protein
MEWTQERVTGFIEGNKRKEIICGPKTSTAFQWNKKPRTYGGTGEGTEQNWRRN